MRIIETEISGLIVVEPKVFEDDRGYFYESYNENTFKQSGLEFSFIQDNQSLSSYGVIRGLHYQINPFAQTKLVRVLEGTILDVAIDIRKNSPTFGKSFSIELNAENKKQLLIPRGFAHGFSVLSEFATVFYKCDGLYNKEAERGINPFDNYFNIDWKINRTKAIVSAKDKEATIFKEAEMNF